MFPAGTGTAIVREPGLTWRPVGKRRSGIAGAGERLRAGRGGVPAALAAAATAKPGCFQRGGPQPAAPPPPEDPQPARPRWPVLRLFHDQAGTIRSSKSVFQESRLTAA